MKKMRLFWLLIGAFMGFSCEREAHNKEIAHDIALYTLDNQTATQLSCQLNLIIAKEKEKIIANEEILSYHVAEHYFTLTAAAINRLKKIKSQTPFYLKVDNQVVYSGFLMPGYLSFACHDVIVIDPISYINNMVWVRYDYANGSGPTNDFRNNAALLAALQKQGKLEK